VRCEPAVSSQAVEASEKDFKDLDDLIKYLKTSPMPLKYQALDLDSAHLRVYANASFANNPDLSSQIGYTVFLTDKHGRANLIAWSSRKCRRVTRSVLAAELSTIGSIRHWILIAVHFEHSPTTNGRNACFH
jgi:hypothetical protein